MNILSTQDLRILKTKKCLTNTLMQLLQKQHFNSITVTQLCQIAMINRSTFYAHYANIDELFKQHFYTIMADLRQDYKTVLENLHRLEQHSMEPLFHHILKHRSFYDILLSENAPLHYLALFNKYIVLFPKEAIEKNAQQNTNLELYYAFCASATMGMIYYWKKSGYQLSPQQMSIQTMKFFTKNI